MGICDALITCGVKCPKSRLCRLCDPILVNQYQAVFKIGELLLALTSHIIPDNGLFWATLRFMKARESNSVQVSLPRPKRHNETIQYLVYVQRVN